MQRDALIVVFFDAAGLDVRVRVGRRVLDDRLVLALGQVREESRRGVAAVSGQNSDF